MFFRLRLSTMVMLLTIASAAVLDSPDSTWLTEDDNTLFSNTDSTLNLAAPPIPINQPLTPSDSDASSLFSSAQLPEEISLSSSTTPNNAIDPSNALLWDLDSSSGILPLSGATEDNNEESKNLFLDDNFQLADCSTSSEEQSLSAFDNTLAKSRLRRRDDGNKCTNPVVTPHTNSQSSSDSDAKDLDLIEQLFADPEFVDIATQARANPNWHFPCFVLTDGLFPWGVCSSGLEKDQYALGGQALVVQVPLTLWSLRNSALVIGMTFSCPLSPPQVFYCCQEFLAGTAQGCLKFFELTSALVPNLPPP